MGSAIVTDEDMPAADMKPAPLLATGPRVINVGLERFAAELAMQGVPVQHVEWAPPAGGDARLANILSKLGS